MIFILLLVVGLCYLLFRKPKCTTTKIRINKQKLQARYLMVVAHPDDELLWGYRYLSEDPKSWKVICITCASDEHRVREFRDVMIQIGVDNYEIWDNENTIVGWRLHPYIVENLADEIKQNNYSKVITHNAYGEYGNLQHIALHNSLSSLLLTKLHFFTPRNKTPQMVQKTKIISEQYNSQRAIINMLKPFHSQY